MSAADAHYAMPVSLDPDRACMAAVTAGNRERALLILMRSHGEAIHRFCRRMVGDALVDDVHQLTFVQAYEGLDGFRGDSSLRTWLYGIARYRCLDALRQQQRMASSRGAVDVGATEPHSDQALAARDVLELCLDKLKPKVREAVILRHAEGLSYPEMGAVCGEEPAALQVRVARALPLLRKCIEARSRR